MNVAGDVYEQSTDAALHLAPRHLLHSPRVHQTFYEESRTPEEICCTPFTAMLIETLQLSKRMNYHRVNAA